MTSYTKRDGNTDTTGITIDGIATISPGTDLVGLDLAGAVLTSGDFTGVMTSDISQKGLSIYGEVANERMGTDDSFYPARNTVSVNNNGNIMAVGSPDENLVRVYEWDGSAWNQLGDTFKEITHNDRRDTHNEDRGELGFAVSLNGDGTRIAISAPNDEPWNVDDQRTYTNSGVVRIYEYKIPTTSEWSEKRTQTYSNYGPSSLDYYYRNIVIKGDDASQVNGKKYWVQVGNDILGTVSEDKIGYCVSLSSDGNVVAVSQPDNNNSTGTSDQYVGLVRVYELNGSSWQQRGNDFYGQYERWKIGSSLSLSNDGSILAIGSETDGDMSTTSNYQFPPYSDNIYNDSRVDASTPWSSIQWWLRDLYQKIGVVQCYEWDAGSSSWNQIGDNIYGNNKDSKAGGSVSLSSDGSILAIGETGYAPDGLQFDSNTGEFDTGSVRYNALLKAEGRVRVYQRDGNAWNQLGSDIVGNQKITDKALFGFSVSLSSDGNILAVGSPKYTHVGVSGAGIVRVYRFNDSYWEELEDGILNVTQINSNFGNTVRISSDGTTVVAVAPNTDNDSKSDVGSLHAYDLNLTKTPPKFTNIILSGADLTGADLTGVELKGANLKDADLTNSVLVNVSSGDIQSDTGTQLPTAYKIVNGYIIGPGVDLKDGVLTGADLTGTTLTGADLTGADLTGADLSNSTLTGVTWTNLDNYKTLAEYNTVVSEKDTLQTEKEAETTRANLAETQLADRPTQAAYDQLNAEKTNETTRANTAESQRDVAQGKVANSPINLDDSIFTVSDVLDLINNITQN